MLVQQQFEIVEGYRPFRFRSLNLVGREALYDTYECEERQLAVVTTNNLHLLSRVRALDMGGFFSHVRGYLRKGPTYYIFSQIDQQEYSLKSYVERMRNGAKVQPYLTLSELDRLTKFVIDAIDILQGESIAYCTLLSPEMILVEENGPVLRFRLAFPMLELIMSDRELYRPIRNHYMTYTQFAAPQIVRYCMDDSEGASYKRTGKEVLYSMGLLMLYAVFGEVFSRDDRIKALTDKRDLQSQIKFRRRNMKILFSEKTLSKTVKILLERNVYMRDDIRTLKIKLSSKQFKLNQPVPDAPLVIPPASIEHVSTIEEEMDGSVHNSTQNSALKPQQVELDLSKNASSLLMKKSKETELSANMYRKNTEAAPSSSEKREKLQQEMFEFRVANSIEDVVDDNFIPFQDIHEKTMNEKLIPPAPEAPPTNYSSPKAAKHLEMTLGNMPIELTLNNQESSQTSQIMMTASQYRFHVEDEVRKFKYRSVMSLLLTVVVATLLGTYYYLQGRAIE